MKKYSINMPVEAFTACPSCRNADNLRQLSFDVYCHGCGWDSSSAFVEAGGLDELIYEYEMRLQRKSQNAAASQRAKENKNLHHVRQAI